MEEFQGPIFFESPEQQETQRLRERNRIAKRASRARRRQQEQKNSDANSSAQSATYEKRPPSRATGSQSRDPGSSSPDARIEVPVHGAQSTTPPSCQAESDLPLWDCSLGNSLDDDWSDFCDPNALPVFSDAGLESRQSQDVCLANYCRPFPPTPESSPSWIYPQPPPDSTVDLSAYVLNAKSPKYGDEGVSSRANQDGFISRTSRLLHIAVRNGNTAILLSLINAGADVNSQDASGSSPLHLAIQFRRASMLDVLINYGANINARNSAGMTPLEVAVRAQDEEIVNILISSGAELS